MFVSFKGVALMIRRKIKWDGCHILFFFLVYLLKSFGQILGVKNMFGINEEVRKYALQKIQNQKSYLDKHFFEIGRDKISMSKLVKNAYINSDKYIAEVNHRVYSLYHYANNKGLKNIFGTITLPTEYHQKIKNTHSNPKFANKHIDTMYDIHTKKPNFENVRFKDYTPKAGARELSRMFKNMLDLRFIKDIPKEDKCYFRVYEPHKDGTPHLHFSLFVPADKVEEVAAKFNKYFTKKYPSLRVDFQTNINNPVAYLMKYILKTFDDLRKEDSKLSDLSLWYVANRITRFYTSRTLISLEIFRKLNGRYNLLELTEMYKDRELTVLLDIDTNKVVSIYDRIGNIYNKKDTKLKKLNSTIKLKYKKKFREPPVLIDGVTYVMIDGKLTEFEPIVPVNKMTSISLYRHYLEMNEDIESFDLNHYGLVKNELINRKHLDDVVMPINSYGSNFEYAV